MKGTTMKHHPPTCRELWDEDLNLVDEEVTGSWRHGVEIMQVYHRYSDNTYWAANFRVSTGGEENELRDGEAEITEVERKEVTTIIWAPKTS